jgi:thiol-disulfide isomerase/thioredoxin
MYAICFILCIVCIVLIFKMNQTTVYRFMKPSCTHCVKSKPEWDQFKSMTSVKCVEIQVDGSPWEQKLADNFKVQSVPCVYKVYSDGQRFEYTGERTAQGYADFLSN